MSIIYCGLMSLALKSTAVDLTAETWADLTATLLEYSSSGVREFQAQGFIFCRPPPRPLKVLGDLRIGAGARGIVLIDQMKQIQHRRSGTELTPPSNTAKSCKCSSAVMRSAWHADLWMVTMGNLLTLMRSNTAVRGSPALQFHCRRGGPRTAAGGRLQLGNDGRSRQRSNPEQHMLFQPGKG
jgi:hypothetical protein